MGSGYGNESERPSASCLCQYPYPNVPIEPVGGQEQHTWYGTCPKCGREWEMNCEKWAEEREEEA
jgi:hypothetical protein